MRLSKRLVSAVTAFGAVHALLVFGPLMLWPEGDFHLPLVFLGTLLAAFPLARLARLPRWWLVGLITPLVLSACYIIVFSLLVTLLSALAWSSSPADALSVFMTITRTPVTYLAACAVSAGGAFSLTGWVFAGARLVPRVFVLGSLAVTVVVAVVVVNATLEAVFGA